MSEAINRLYTVYDELMILAFSTYKITDRKLDRVAHACNPRTWEVKIDLWVQGYLSLDSKF